MCRICYKNSNNICLHMNMCKKLKIMENILLIKYNREYILFKIMYQYDCCIELRLKGAVNIWNS